MFGLIPIIFIGLIVYIIYSIKRIRHNRNGSHLLFAYSREDALSQVFFVLTCFFLGVALLALNREVGEVFSWRTIFLFTSFVGIFIAYYYKAILLLPLGLFSLVIWWGSQANAWVEGENIQTTVITSVGMFYFIGLYLIGQLYEGLEKYRRFSLVYTVLGLICTVFSFFILSSKIGLDAFSKMLKGSSFLSSFPLSILFFVAGFGALSLLIYILKEKRIRIREFSVLFFIIFFFFVFSFLPPVDLFSGTGYWFGYSQSFSDTGIIWALFFNVFIFLLLLGVILSGYGRRETWRINIGAFSLFVLIAVKYFDWFFDFFDKSIFFLSAGIILFMVGFLMEKGRRYMIAQMKEKNKNI